MTDPLPGGPGPAPDLDDATMRRLLLHEARVHAVPGRDLRDLGDGILLHDPVEREPFWNRLEGLRWPEDPAAFDRRLTETLVLFASIGRTPHIWATPIHDSPGDLVARLESNGFRDMGMGNVMILVDPRPARLSATQPRPDGVTIERLAGVEGAGAETAASAIVEVLIDAFEVDPERRPAIEGETVASLSHAWFTHYLIRADGEPAAVARRATFEGLTYLSSIGTAGWARGRGLGTLVTRMAASEGLADGSAFVYLGVFADNSDAIGVYQRSGFQQVGSSCPDMLLW
jgi:ribosomal protein S18 acetylase RimI-like enzyme